MEITIARGLTELKTLKGRIEKQTSSTWYVCGSKKSAKKVDGYRTRDEFSKDAKSTFDSIMSLKDRYSDIKSAIVISNAETKIKVGSKEYMVAEAIERKNSIQFEKRLLSQLESQRNSIVAQVNKNNEAVDRNLDKHIETILGNESNNGSGKNDTIVKSITDSYLEQHSFEIIDPIGIDSKIKNLREEIEDFESEVDACLSESNAITKITIED